MTNKTKKAIRELARLWCCDCREFRGRTLEDLFYEAEDEGGVSVYWQCWSDDELQTVIG